MKLPFIYSISEFYSIGYLSYINYVSIKVCTMFVFTESSEMCCTLIANFYLKVTRLLARVPGEYHNEENFLKQACIQHYRPGMQRTFTPA